MVKGCDFGLPVMSNVTCWLAYVLFVFCVTNRARSLIHDTLTA